MTGAAELTEASLGFIYAILGASDWMEAGKIWDKNPEARTRAHAELAALSQPPSAQEAEPVAMDRMALAAHLAKTNAGRPVLESDEGVYIHRDVCIEAMQALFASPVPALPETGVIGERKFKRGDRVRKIKGSSWQGPVRGFYATSLTADGIAVESEREPGNVQIYPSAAFELVPEDENAG